MVVGFVVWLGLMPVLSSIGAAATLLDAFVLVGSVAAQVLMVKGFVEAWAAGCRQRCWHVPLRESAVVLHQPPVFRAAGVGGVGLVAVGARSRRPARRPPTLYLLRICGTRHDEPQGPHIRKCVDWRGVLWKVNACTGVGFRTASGARREQLRLFVDAHGRPPTQAEQAGVMQSQIAAEDAAMRARRVRSANDGLLAIRPRS